MTIRIILADDHTLVRESLAGSMEEQEDMNIVAQAQDGIRAVQLARELSPDVVVMDVNMPKLNGIEATREIVRGNPDIRVVGLSMLTSKRFVTEMFSAGATGYLLKDCEFDELNDAVRRVVRGERVISPGIPGVTMDDLDRPPGDKEKSAFSILTPREREVLQLLAEGRSTKEIGACLGLSPKTIEAHRLRTMRKLGINNVARLTKYALQEGLTTLE